MAIDWQKLDEEIGYKDPSQYKVSRESSLKDRLLYAAKKTGKFGYDIGMEIPKSVGRALTMPASLLYETYKGAGGKKFKAGEAIEKFSPMPKKPLDYLERFADIALLAPKGTSQAIGKLTGLSKAVSKIGKATKLKTTKTQKLVREVLKETKDKAYISKSGISASTKKMFKKLTKNERKIFEPFVEGRTTLTKKPSSDFIKAVKTYQKSAEQQEIRLLRKGMSPTELVERRWLPLKVSTKKSKEELQKIVAKDIETAIKLRKPMQPIYYPIKVDTSKKVWRIGSPFRKKGAAGFEKKATGAGLSMKRINNPEVVVAARRTEEAMHNIHNSLIEKVAKKFGSKEMKEGLVEFRPQGDFRIFRTKQGAAGITTKVPKVFVKPEVRNEVNKFLLGRAEILKSLDKVFFPTIDTVNSIFKIGVLPLRLAWSVVNTQGSAFLNAVGGVPAKAYINAMKPSYRKLMTKTARKRLLSSKFASSEAGARSLFRKAESALYRPNQYIEDHFRWVHFIGKSEKFAKQRLKVLKQTGKMLPQKTDKEIIMGLMKNSKSIHKKSVKEVNKYLFDYSNLPPVEKEIMKRVFPFWSWIRNITILGGKLAYEKPRTAAITYQIYEAMKKKGLRKEELPEGSEWMEGMIKTPLGMTKEGKFVIQEEHPDSTAVYWNWRYLYPFYDVGRLSASSLTPLLKVPIERMGGGQIFNKEMKKFKAPYLKKGEEAPPIPKGLENLIKPTIKYGGITGSEVQFAKPSLLRHAGMQVSPTRLYEKLKKPGSTYSATGELMLDKKGEIKYPNSRTAALLQYLLAIGLYPRDLEEAKKKSKNK